MYTQLYFYVYELKKNTIVYIQANDTDCEIEIEEPIKITDNIYAVKYFNDLLFFCKKIKLEKIH